MSKTNQTLRDVFHKNGLNYSQIVGEENTIISMGLEEFNQALKELEELLLECKPEKKTKKDVPDPYEVGIHATIPVAQASGYNQAIDDYEKNIKAIL